MVTVWAEPLKLVLWCHRRLLLLDLLRSPVGQFPARLARQDSLRRACRVCCLLRSSLVGKHFYKPVERLRTGEAARWLARKLTA